MPAVGSQKNAAHAAFFAICPRESLVEILFGPNAWRESGRLLYWCRKMPEVDAAPAKLQKMLGVFEMLLHTPKFGISRQCVVPAP